MPPPSYPAQISAAVDRSSLKLPVLSARAALDAYAANPHLRSSPTFEFLHFAVIGTHKVHEEFDVDDADVDYAVPFIDVSVLDPGTPGRTPTGSPSHCA